MSGPEVETPKRRGPTWRFYVVMVLVSLVVVDILADSHVVERTVRRIWPWPDPLFADTATSRMERVWDVHGDGWLMGVAHQYRRQGDCHVWIVTVFGVDSPEEQDNAISAIRLAQFSSDHMLKRWYEVGYPVSLSQSIRIVDENNNPFPRDRR